MICLSSSSLEMSARLMVVMPPMTTFDSFLLRDLSSNIKLVLLTGMMLMVLGPVTSDFLTLLLRELSIDRLTSSALISILNSLIIFILRITLSEQSTNP